MLTELRVSINMSLNPSEMDTRSISEPEWKNPAPGQSTIKQIAEDATDSTVIMRLVAEDKDISNSPLQYSIVSQVPATPVLFVVVGDTVKPAPDAQFDVDASNAVRSYSLTIRYMFSTCPLRSKEPL